MRRILFSIFLLVSTSACAPTAARYQQNMESWIGLPKAQMLESWGAPAQVSTVDATTEIMHYLRSWTEQRPQVMFPLPNNQRSFGSATVVGPLGTTTAYGSGTTLGTQWVPAGGGIMTYTCQTNVRVEHSYIRHITWQGNGCVAH